MNTYGIEPRQPRRRFSLLRALDVLIGGELMPDEIAGHIRHLERQRAKHYRRALAVSEELAYWKARTKC